MSQINWLYNILLLFYTCYFLCWPYNLYFLTYILSLFHGHGVLVIHKVHMSLTTLLQKCCLCTEINECGNEIVCLPTETCTDLVDDYSCTCSSPLYQHVNNSNKNCMSEYAFYFLKSEELYFSIHVQSRFHLAKTPTTQHYTSSILGLLYMHTF